jgi:cytochrome c-type biogenesis protein
MTGLEVSYAGAFLAGLLSFLSPCVLPLVPPYLCFLGGVTFEELQQEDAAPAGQRKRIMLAALAFVLGFATIFVGLGATASVVGQFLAEYLPLLAKIAGGVIIILGLHFLGVIRIPLLYREARAHVEAKPAGFIGAYIIGLAFAFGWTPCVGPVLAAILFKAGSTGDISQGIGLLAVYAAGIGLPFLAAAAAVGPFMRLLKRFRPWLGRVERIMGLLLIGTGLLFLTGSMADIAQWILETFPGLAELG